MENLEYLENWTNWTKVLLKTFWKLPGKNMKWNFFLSKIEKFSKFTGKICDEAFSSKVPCLDLQVYQNKVPATAADVPLDIPKLFRTAITCLVLTT